MSILSKPFLKATAERAIKTTAQTAAALLVADGTGLLDTGWVALASAAGMAGLVSVLTSIGSATTGAGPSLTNAEALADTTTVAVTVPADVHINVTADDPEFTPDADTTDQEGH